MTAPPKMTPMLRQYLEIKEQHPQDILFYRMGDFYEMFFEDAEIASKILGITLTSRNNKSDTERVPMCGIPYHAARSYIAKLVKAGKRVAICEQVEDPAEAKGIVRREVIRLVSPGVVTDDQLLDDKDNCYVAAVSRSVAATRSEWGIGFLDLSTGEFLAGEFFEDTDVPEPVIDQFTRMTPAELLINEEDVAALSPFIDALRVYMPELCITTRLGDLFHPGDAQQLLLDHFQLATLDGFGCGSFVQGMIAAAVLLDYATETQKTEVDHITRLTPINLDAVLLIDDSSRRNLELTHTIIGNKRDGSLLAVLDKTCTPMGARLLKKSLLNPLQDKNRINERLDSVAYLHANSTTRQNLRNALASIYDIERLNSRMVLGQGNGRDALALKASLADLPAIKELLATCETKQLMSLHSELDTCDDLHDLLERSIADDPPITLRDGNLIKRGYNEELDELVLLLQDGKKLILGLENEEREKTGIAKLKIGFNKVFGYYIEISNVNLDKVPDHYIRKQTLVNAERFITPELKDFENRVLNAQERRLDLEYRLFGDIRKHIADNSLRLSAVAHLLARVDVFACLAEIARNNHYVKPRITEDGVISITEGRHPVIERALPAGKFVPNDVHLDQEKNQVIIITGPNMAGKSTILRQTALIVLMAQMGGFVPAEKAAITVVDRIFTRVGAMDDLRRGQSTFMVEMSETANILNNATPRSLVILDEIGRGTSTYDGLSIAWAVAEALVDKDGIGVKTMFATHYHELTELAQSRPRVLNYSVSVKEWNNTIIFLHKLVRGGTSRSYGIQVAALAGVPTDVVSRAEDILKSIDHSSSGMRKQAQEQKSGISSERIEKKPNQLSLFTTPSHPLIEQMEKISVDDLSPRQALEMLYRLKALL